MEALDVVKHARRNHRSMTPADNDPSSALETVAATLEQALAHFDPGAKHAAAVKKSRSRFTRVSARLKASNAALRSLPCPGMPLTPAAASARGQRLSKGALIPSSRPLWPPATPGCLSQGNRFPLKLIGVLAMLSHDTPLRPLAFLEVSVQSG
jgi:hypothetical protein